jgi:hypothetical protein
MGKCYNKNEKPFISDQAIAIKGNRVEFLRGKLFFSILTTCPINLKKKRWFGQPSFRRAGFRFLDHADQEGNQVEDGS